MDTYQLQKYPDFLTYTNKTPVFYNLASYSRKEGLGKQYKSQISPLPLHLYLQIHLMRTGDFLQTGRDVGAVEIIGAAQFCDYQQMMADLRTRHQGIADALAKVTAKTHLIEQARLIGIDATGEILGVKIAETALQSQPPPMISDVFIQQITAAGSISFPVLRIIHTRLGTPVFVVTLV